MSHTSNTPSRLLYVDQLVPQSEGSIAYVKDAKGFGKYGIDSQTLAYSKGGSEWIKINDETSVIPSAESLWNVGGVYNDWNPDTGSFNLSSIQVNDSSNNYGGTGNGIYTLAGFIDMPINGYTIKVFFNYMVKDSLRTGGGSVPAIIQSHGWGSSPSTYSSGQTSGVGAWVDNNYAVISYDWAGTYAGSRSYPTDRITLYPSELNRLNQYVNAGADDANQSSIKNISDVKTMDMYYWNAIPKRVLSYLRSLSYIDKSKIGFSGYSWGGTLAWNMCSDSRIAAVVSWYGVGWIHYWRNNNVYRYNMLPYTQPTFSDGNNRYISSLDCQAHAKRAKAPVLWLTGTNEYHGRLDWGLSNFDLLPSGINGSFAFEANQPHNLQVNTVQDELLWFNKYLKGQNITWYNSTTPTFALTASGPNIGYPMVTISPDAPSSLSAIQIWYSLEDPSDVTRTWIQSTANNNGNGTWSAVIPVDNIYRYVFAYGLLTYNNTVAICTKLGATIPNDLGNAVSIPNSYFNPASATSSTLNLWLDANDKNTHRITTNNKLSAWMDKSSSANHAIQSTSTNQPTLSANYAYGLSAISLNNSGFVSTDISTQKPYFDLFIVTRYDGGTSWQPYPNPSTIYMFSAAQNSTYINGVSSTVYGNGIFGTYISNDANNTLNTGTSGGTSWINYCDFYFNGSLTSSANSTTSRTVLPTMNASPTILNYRFKGSSLGVLGYTIGGIKSGVGYYNGTICEIIAYNALLSDSERQKVEGYLAYKWGMRNLLPSNHPYKSTRPT